MTNGEGDDILLVVGEDPGRFRVYIDRRLDLVVQVVAPELCEVEGVQGLLSRIKISAATPLPHIAREYYLAWKRMQGECCVLALRGQVEEARSSLAGIERYIVGRATEVARFWYLSAIATVLSVLLVTATSAAIYTRWLAEQGEWSVPGSPPPVPHSPLRGNETTMLTANVSAGGRSLDRPNVVEGMSLYAVQILLLAGLAGAFGAALSMMLRLNKLEIDPAAGKWAHYGEVVFRLTYGAIAACILIAAIKADLVLGLARSTSEAPKPYDEFWLLVIFGAVAGASEFLVPNFLLSLESGIVSAQANVANEGAARATTADQPR